MNNLVRARCRLIPDFNVVAVIGVALAALFLGLAMARPPRAGDDWFALAMMFAVFGATPIYWLIARARGAIIFDESGAHWRTAFGSWKSARWDEIENADVRLTSTGKRMARWKFVVATRSGEFSWTGAFENAEALAPLAARFCAIIPANVEDWPRRFGYRSGENFIVALAFPLFGAWLVAPILMMDALRHWPANLAVYAALYGWPLTLLGFALFGLAIEAIPLLMLLAYVRSALNYWWHRDEIFEATPRGLSQRKGARQPIFVAWDELQTLHIEARGPLIVLPFYRLQTARGELSWNSGLYGKHAFAATLFERAPQLQSVVQAYGGESLNDVPDETLEFNFKTRTLRAVLWLGAVLSLVSWYHALFGPIPPRNGGEPMPTWFAYLSALSLTAATIAGAQLFRRGCIVLDTRGICWSLPFRARFVMWEEIDELLILDHRYCLQLGARRVPLGIASLYPVPLEQLLEAIETRALKARGGWKNVGKATDGRKTE